MKGIAAESWMLIKLLTNILCLPEELVGQVFLYAYNSIKLCLTISPAAIVLLDSLSLI
jgi:hypothetical protein